MSLISVVMSNLWAKKFRSVGIAAAVALAVMTVVSLIAVSSGLESSAAQLLEIGKSDFTVEQHGISDIFYSEIHQSQLRRVETTPGVKSAIGVLLENVRLNASNPFFLEVGIAPQDLTDFGVTVVAGHPYAADAGHDLMLGWRAAQDLGLKVGGRLFVNGSWNTVVGIFSTGIAYGDLGSMFPLSTLQAHEHAPGTMTLLFVKVLGGHSVDQVEASITSQDRQLATITTAAQFGRADQNITYLQAAATGSTVLAILIGAVIVGDSMLLSVFERTRELGLLRAIGWSRTRVVRLIVGEGLILAVLGSAIGVVLSFVATAALQRLPQLAGILHANFTEGAFWRGLYTGLGMALIGALYPALRAANLAPLKALSHE